MNPMKDGGVAETRSLERTVGRTDGRKDGITHTRTDEGHFYSPPPPTLGDNEKEHSSEVYSFESQKYIYVIAISSSIYTCSFLFP